MIGVILAIVAIVVIPRYAVKGEGYRGIYGAIALGAVLLAYVTFSLMATPLPRNPTEADLLGHAFFSDNGPPLIFVCIGSAIGGLFGVVLYRPTPAQSSPTSETAGRSA